MAPCEITEDYYAILEVQQTATPEVIRKSYRRLAVALHPDKNLANPDATASFQCWKLSRAYETLSNPETRRIYDLRWVHIKDLQSREWEEKKRQAATADAERKRAAEETLNRERQQRVFREHLQPLEQLRSHYESSIFEINRVIRRLTADLKRLQDQDNEETRKEREKNSWFTYLTSPIYGRTVETEEQKQVRETECLQRHASKSIKRSELQQKEARLRNLESGLKDTDSKIAAEEQRYETEARAQAAKRQEQLRKEQETRRREYEQQERERQAEKAAAQAKVRKEEAARAAKHAQEAKEAQEHARAARQAEALRRAETLRQAEAAQQRLKKSSCRHNAFWPKLEGSHLCGNCHTTTRRFAFQCPGCRMIACATCRQSLRGEKGTKNRTSNQHFRFSPDTDPGVWADAYFD